MNLTIEQRIKYHSLAAQQAKGQNYEQYWQHRCKMLLAQAELRAEQKGLKND